MEGDGEPLRGTLASVLPADCRAQGQEQGDPQGGRCDCLGER